MSRAPSIAALLALSLAGCGGVHHTLRTDVPQPATLAVLPFAGDADVATREAARALVQSRLAARGYRLAETPWVDRVLSEHGWLRDPAKFDGERLAIDQVIAALGVDAVVVGRDLDESSFNVFLLRRHAFGGALAVQRPAGTYWSANHSAGAFGGFLLMSGQLFTEVRAQGDHRTPMSTLALVDEFVADVVATVPARTLAPDTGAEPAIGQVRASRSPSADGATRIVVESDATPGCTLWLDLPPTAVGVPMVALADAPGRYRGTHDLPAEATPGTVVVRARSRYGRETRVEVKP